MMRQRIRRCRNRGNRSKRLGAAVSELAISLPVVTLLVFGGIETADIIHLKGNLRNVAYEGGRTAARFNSDSAEVMTQMNLLMAGIDVADATITMELPGGASDVKDLARGDLIKIFVTAPASSNTVGPLKLHSSRTITAEAIVVRE